MVYVVYAMISLLFRNSLRSLESCSREAVVLPSVSRSLALRVMAVATMSSRSFLVLKRKFLVLMSRRAHSSTMSQFPTR